MLYRIKDLSFSYNGKQNILDNINLEINEGELLCVLGKNGSGKTTLFNCLLGIINNYKGNIYLDNKDLKKIKEKDIAKLVGYVPQTSSTCFGYTVLDYVLMGLANEIGIFSKPNDKHVQKTLKALESLDLLEYKDRPFMELSGGERQQVTIARAIVSSPKILIFDEPTSHLDYGNQVKVLKMIKELSSRGYAIAFSSHDPNQALMFNCEVALFNGNGHIEKANVKDLLTEEKLSSIYGSSVKLVYAKDLKRSICTFETI